MITLVTGTPGTGKTMWIVSELVRMFFASTSFSNQLLAALKNAPAKKHQINQRDVFVHGIPELDFGVPYTLVYCRSALCDVCQSQSAIEIPAPLFNQDGQCVNWAEIEVAEAERDSVRYVENWSEWATVGSLIILDEVQRIWRPRSAGTTVPPEISALETHRHKGIDFWLISQSPKLLDMNIRRLVGRHIHLVANWKGRTQHEWPECKESTSSTSDAISRPYILKKSIFTKYKSSSLHTKLEKRLPLAIYIIAGAVALLIYFGYDIYSRHSTPVPVPASIPTLEQPSPSTLNSVVKAASDLPGSKSFASTGFDFTPRVRGRDETAPAYDGLLKVQSVPYPVRCYSFSTGSRSDQKVCTCKTDQGTIYSTPYDVCMAYVRHEVYNPYLPPKGAGQGDVKVAGNP